MRTNSDESEDNSSECEQPVSLPELSSLTSLPSGLFMMETSGRDRLTARQACAVESAASRSGLVVYLVIFSRTLSLRDNSTCQLYR